MCDTIYFDIIQYLKLIFIEEKQSLDSKHSHLFHTSIQFLLDLFSLI